MKKILPLAFTALWALWANAQEVQKDTTAVDQAKTEVSYEIWVMMNQWSGNSTYHYNNGLIVPVVTYGWQIQKSTKENWTFRLNMSWLEWTFRENTYPDKWLIEQDIDNHLYNLYLQRQSKNWEHTVTAGQEWSGYVWGSQSTTPRSNNTQRFLDISNTTPFRLSSIKYTLTKWKFTGTIWFINGNQKWVLDLDGEPGVAFQFLSNIGKNDEFLATISWLHTESELYTVPMLTYKPNDKLSISLQWLNYQNRSNNTSMNAIAVDAGYQLDKNFRLWWIWEYTNTNGVDWWQLALTWTYNVPKTSIKTFTQAWAQYTNGNLNPNINAWLFVNLNWSKVFKKKSSVSQSQPSAERNPETQPIATTPIKQIETIKDTELATKNSTKIMNSIDNSVHRDQNKGVVKVRWIDGKSGYYLKGNNGKPDMNKIVIDYN